MFRHEKVGVYPANRGDAGPATEDIACRRHFDFVPECQKGRTFAAERRDVISRIGIIATLTIAAAAGLPACQRSGESVRPGAAREEMPSLVEDYLDVADAASTESTAIDEQFLADALRKLAAALGTLNLGDLELQVDLRVAAEHVVSDPQPAGAAAAVRNSLLSAAAAIDADGTGDPGLRRSAESLSPDRPLRDQAATIRDFLRLSGAAVRRVARG
jgi:hypothetical protein